MTPRHAAALALARAVLELETPAERVERAVLEAESPARSALLEAAGLTRREHLVLGLLDCGGQVGDVAEVLEVSPDAVRVHRKNARRKVRALFSGLYAQNIRLVV